MVPQDHCELLIFVTRSPSDGIQQVLFLWCSFYTLHCAVLCKSSLNKSALRILDGFHLGTVSHSVYFYTITAFNQPDLLTTPSWYAWLPHCFSVTEIEFLTGASW